MIIVLKPHTSEENIHRMYRRYNTDRSKTI